MPDYCQGFGGNRAENSDGRRSAKRDEDTSNGEFQVNSEKRDTFKKILFPVITAAAVVASALIAAFLPSAVWLLFLLMPVATVFLSATVALNKNPWTALLFIALFIATALLLYLFFAPTGVATGIAFRKKKTVNSAVTASAIVAMICGIAVFCAFAYEGHPTFDTANVIEPIKESIAEAANDTADVILERGKGGISIYEMFFARTTLTSDKLAAQRPALAADLHDMIILNLPTVIGGAFLLIAAAAYFLTKALLKRTTFSVGFATGLTEIRISKAGATLMLLSWIVMFFGSAEMTDASALIYDMTWLFAIYIFETLMNFVFAGAGLSVFIYLMKSRSVPMNVKTPMIIAVVIGFLLMRTTVFSLLGTVDSYRDLRRLQGERV